MDKETYFKNHPWYKYQENLRLRDGMVNKYMHDLRDYIVDIKNGDVLEIGTGIGNFTSISVISCEWKVIPELILTIIFFKYHQNEFVKYQFIQSRFQEYLDGNNKFDVIFTSHLFEHLDESERMEIVQHIGNSLTEWGIWINYMPNADSIIQSTNGMYVDITHYRIYNDHSFSQLINYCWKNFCDIRHINSFVWTNFFKRSIHNIFLFFTKIYYLWMWMPFLKCILGKLYRC